MTKRERSIIAGSLLGDGYIERNGRGFRFQVLHSYAQRAYVEWKYRELRTVRASPPTVLALADHRVQKSYLGVRFRTRNTPILEDFYACCYRQGRKTISRAWLRMVRDPLALAVWFMDDGGRRKDCRGMFLNTLSFSEAEHGVLQAHLRDAFGIGTRLHWVQDGFRLYIPSDQSLAFVKIVAPYIIPTMWYKLPYDPVTTDPLPLYRKGRERRYPIIGNLNSVHTLTPQQIVEKGIV